MSVKSSKFKMQSSKCKVTDGFKTFVKQLLTLNFKLLTSPRGFTLLELLVVVAIIGLLASVIVASLGAVKQKSRDTQRKHDLQQMETALQAYYEDNNKYPMADVQQISGAAWGGEWLPYMAKVPKDPLSSQQYSYQTAVDQSWYRIYARLENCQDPQRIPGVVGCSQFNYAVTSPNVAIVPL